MRNTESESATVGNHCTEETSGFLSDTPAYKTLRIVTIRMTCYYSPTSNLPGKAGEYE